MTKTLPSPRTSPTSTVHAFNPLSRRPTSVLVWLLFLCLSLGFSQRASAGPTLRASDLVVVDFQQDDTDGFKALVLAPIPANSVLFFTDAQWLADGNLSAANLGNTEWQLKWTSPASVVPAGTIITFSLPTGSATADLGTVNSVTTTASAGGFSFAGDQLVIYQTDDNTPSLLSSKIQRLNDSGSVEAGPIYSFNADNALTNNAWSTQVNGWGTVPNVIQTSPGISTTGSHTPPNSVVFDNSGDANRSTANAFGLGSFDITNVVDPMGNTKDLDNLRYNGPITAADKTAWLIRIHNPANWIGRDDVPWGTGQGSLAGQSTVPIGAGDTTAPVFDVAPATANITASGFDLSASLDEGGTLFYVVVANAATAPTSAQVVAGQNGSGAAALANGSQAVASTPFSHTFTVSALSAGTAYDVYVVARDDEGTPNLQATPVKVDVSTAAAAPTVTTPTQTAITATTATLGGNVTADGGGSITARGVVYSRTSLNNNPQLSGANVTHLPHGTNSTGVFTVNATSLLASTQYSFAAYATNSTGTTYTTPVSTFTTSAAQVAVSSLNIVNTTPTHAGTVNWTLTFASAVTGVTSSNFSLTGATVGASVGTPTVASGGGLTWNVPVTTGADGTLTLNLANATSLSAPLSNAPFTGQSYTIDKTPPTVLSVTRLTPLGQATSNPSVTFRVTYSEEVTGVAAERFAVLPVGSSNVVGSISSVTPVSPGIYHVGVNITSGSGEFRLRVLD